MHLCELNVYNIKYKRVMTIRILVILICMLMKISTFASNESLNPRMERCTLADYQNNDN
jgi:hypothetical protein